MDLLVTRASRTLVFILGAVLTARSGLFPQARQGLGRGIPGDVSIYASWYSARGSGLADSHLTELRRALVRCGFAEEFTRRLRQERAEGDRAAFDEASRHWLRVLGGIEWWRLLSHEVALGCRVGSEGVPEIVCLFRVGQSDRDRVLGELRDLLFAIAAEGSGLELELGQHRGVPTALLVNPLEPREQLCAAGTDDVVALGSPLWFVRQSLALLEGRGREPALILSGEYARSARDLAAAAAQDDDSPQASRLEIYVRPGALLSHAPKCDVFEKVHFISVASQDRCRWWWRADLSADGGVLAQALEKQRPVGDWRQYIPATAAGFRVSAGAEPSGLVDAALDFLAALSDNSDLPEILEQEMERDGLRLKQDVLAHLSGRWCEAVLPAVADPEGKSFDRVFHFELQEGPDHREALRAGVNRLAQQLPKFGFRVQEVKKEEAAGAPVHRLDLSVLFGAELFVGVDDRGLVIATSEAALREFRATAAGNAASLAQAAVPATSALQGDVVGESGGSCEPTLALMRQALRLGGALGSLGEGPGSVPGLRPLLAALPRLDGVVASLGFLGEWSSRTVRLEKAYVGAGGVSLRRERRL